MPVGGPGGGGGAAGAGVGGGGGRNKKSKKGKAGKTGLAAIYGAFHPGTARKGGIKASVRAIEYQGKHEKATRIQGPTHSLDRAKYGNVGSKGIGKVPVKDYSFASTVRDIKTRI
jgi:hypothetical protein